MCYTYAHLFALPVICLCLFTVYGPRQRPDMAIFKFTDMLAGEKPLPVFGDGQTARDYTYVDDIVDGTLGALSAHHVRPLQLGEQCRNILSRIGPIGI